MKRQRAILITSLVALLAIVLGLWYGIATRRPVLRFVGFRYYALDGRWYADLQMRNRSGSAIHCDGYVVEVASGVRTNDSMLDFRCTVEAGNKRVETWPLWFATWLDLKPGESAKLSLNIEANDPPRRVGLRYSNVVTPPGKLDAFVGRVRYYARRVLHIRWRRAPVNGSQVVWCPATLAFDAALANRQKTKTPLEAGKR